MFSPAFIFPCFCGQYLVKWRRMGKRSRIELLFFCKRVLYRGQVAPGRDLVLTGIGFPFRREPTKPFFPVALKAKAITGLLRLKGAYSKEATFFAVDRSFPAGFSGGPVLSTPEEEDDNQITCFGLLHGGGYTKFGGFTTVVSSIAIVETIKMATAKTY